MTLLELWLFTTAIPGLSNTLTVFAIMTGSIAIGLLIYGLAQKQNSNVCPEMKSSQQEAAQAEAVFKVLKRLAPCALVLILLASIMPCERQMMLIAGGYTVTNNEDMRKMPTNAAKAVNAWLNAVAKAGEDEASTKSKK